jgi:hypothetical protein
MPHCEEQFDPLKFPESLEFSRTASTDFAKDVEEAFVE